MLKILSIGNSFSQDAQRYIYRVAKEAGLAVKAVNLYIGGCPLSRHYRNMLSEAPAYSMMFNGEETGLAISIRDALLLDDWDIVTLQQLSSDAPKPKTYEPYLSALADYVRRLAPSAKPVMHETWAYEENSPRLTRELGYETPEEMTAELQSIYAWANEKIKGSGIIPSGAAMLSAYRRGIAPIHRDTFHAGLGAGRLLLAAVWLSCLFGQSLAGTRIPKSLDAPVSDDEWKLILAVAEESARAYGWLT